MADNSSRDEKLQQFKAFDFDSNKEWKAHLHNVELPANAAGALSKVKAKWYKKTVDPEFNISWAAAAGPGTAAPQAQRHGASSQQQQQQRPASTSGSSTNAAGRPPGAAIAGQPNNRELTMAILQGLVLFLTLFYLQPFKAALSAWSYSALLNVLLLSQTCKILSAQGLPAAWNWATVRAWLSRVSSTSDVHYFLLALAGRLSQPLTALLVPFFVLATYSVAHFLSEHFSSHPLWTLHGARAHALMMRYQREALLFNAQSEIMLGFFLVVALLLPTRQPMLLLMVWNVLRMRFWSTDAAWYHRQVWGVFDEKSRSIRQRFPLLQRVVDFGVRYFHQGRG